MSPPLPPLTNSNLPTLPDILLTALSVCFFFTSTRFHNTTTTTTTTSNCPFFSSPLNPRRFLKIPAMSQTSTSSLSSTTNPNKNNRRHSFASPQSLSEWLKPRLPSDSFATWGVKPGTKNVHNLWLELSQGETSLADSDPPVRTVQVVTVRVIGKDGKILVESHQELSDGEVRERGRPLSEKMKPNEEPESAAVRGIKEELGSVIGAETEVCDIVTIDPNSYEMRVEERNSGSYPGLPGCYVLHILNATVEGLPEGDFCTYEVDEYGDSDDKKIAHQAVSVKKHYWKWVSSDSVQP
ncbi:hypothetical protein L195_g015704 [Trifolium pratense]|uniref:Uncharacterized protein n=2 Tax=Trifolium pratense TaxID=57577 RepID=A0ACB0JEB4_TRIPR|nr:uncharacterized protein LOC123916806 [Trifolium pratense]PNX92564.1 hypothetical protein L195_g015704 [Trifolium pratense]CAJ2641837.1 unnamed protein product [Trifolium pratense]